MSRLVTKGGLLASPHSAASDEVDCWRSEGRHRLVNLVKILGFQCSPEGRGEENAPEGKGGHGDGGEGQGGEGKGLSENLVKM